MPESPDPNRRKHPWRAGLGDPITVPVRLPPEAGARELPAVAYGELAVTTNFTFRTGASHPEEYVEQAVALGYRAIAITDTNTLAGVVRAHVAAKDADFPLVIGCRITAMDQPQLALLVYPTDREAYARLCTLLTLGKRRAAKGQCNLTLHDVLDHQQGLLAVAIPPAKLDLDALAVLAGIGDVFDDDRLSIAASFGYRQDDQQRVAQIAAVCDQLGVPMVAINDVHYHVPRRQPLQDVLTCIRYGCTIQEAGLHLLPNAERHLKHPDEMARLFADYPEAIARTVEIAERARGFNLDQLRYEYPSEVVPAGKTAMQHLCDLAWEGAHWRYPEGVPDKVRGQIEHELALIEELNYPHYFLTVHDLVKFARSQGILCQGRGAAANSAVCYCLDVTAVNPDRINMLFERFISRERNEPPDIDIDFEHERREEVIQYIYRKYGRDRAALTAEVITYRSRLAVREVSKALGLSLDCVDQLAKNLDGGIESLDPGTLRRMGLNPNDHTIQQMLQLAEELIGFPRHLSQHVGGFVMTQRPLCEMVPIENAAMPDRTTIEWDKDDIDAAGLMKVDVLGLGMLTCIRKCFELVRQHHGRELTLANIPTDDDAVYDMICDADTVGVFQIESRAQMSMLPRLRPREYYDLVIEVAIVRPGPIVGNMVHPYLRRRHGDEPVSYPDEVVQRILGRTLGIPLFQEQAMALSIHCAGFTPGMADQLRRAIAAWKRKQHVIQAFRQKIIDGMTSRGYPLEFAEQTFDRIKGFSEYGFPESHAASFALLVCVSSWLKHYYPAVFTCALINSQPMGFYAPAQLIRDAQRHGVDVRPVDVNHSQWDCTLEPPEGMLRLGLRLISGVRQHEAQRLVLAVQEHGAFRSVESLWRACDIGVATLRRLAEADAFQSMDLDRQQALWQIMQLSDERAPLFELTMNEASETDPDARRLPPVNPYRKVVQDVAAMGLSLKPHPVMFLRRRLERERVTTAAELADAVKHPHGSMISVAGLCILRQRPSTAHGIVFMTLEDETGSINLIVRPHIYARYRRAARTARAMRVQGRIERQGQVVHVLVRRIQTLDDRLAELTVTSRDFR